jgi:UDP-glucose 4-epimerase
VIKSFEEVSGKKLSFEKAPRRPGDVIAVYANNDKAREDLNWTPKFDLAAMMKTAWDWELALNEKQQLAKT